MGVVGRLDQYASTLAWEFDETTANNPSITGLGTYYASEFNENVVETIATSGLVLNLDAANPASYPGSGTTWTDLSGRGNTGTLVNTPTYSSANGGSLVFDGVDDYVEVTNSNGFGEVNTTPTMTLELWANINRKSGGGSQFQHLAGFRASNFNFYFLLLDNSGASVNTEARIATTSSLSSINTDYINYFNKWTHIVFVANETRGDLYFNGTLIGSTTGITGSFGGSSGNFRIGLDPGGSGYSTKGNISSAKVYNRALSATEITQNYNALAGRFGLSPTIPFLSANVFAPYDPVYDEVGGTLFGAGQGRYMRQNTDKSVIVYNEIDEITDFYGRGIVRDGLVLDLDAGKTASYPGSGTTWTDLSGGGNTGTLAGNTSFSSQGYFVLDGVDGTRIGTSGPLYPTTWNQAVTFEIWAYFDADGTWHNTFSGGLFSRGSAAGTLGLTRMNTDNSVRMWLRDIGGTATAAGTVVRDAWYQIVGTWGGDANLNLKLYLNGVETGSNTKTTISGSPDIGGYNLGGMSSTLSGSPGNYMKGRISAARMYDRELSAAEILQNYNALKHRFGL